MGDSDAAHAALSESLCLYAIFSKVSEDVADGLACLSACSLVCRAWREFLEDDRLWERCYVAAYGKPEPWEMRKT